MNRNPAGSRLRAHVCPVGHTSRVAPLEDASTYASAPAYVCTQSTGVTVVDNPIYLIINV